MTFTESNTVAAHLRDLFADAASARPVHLAHTGGKIAGLDWHYVAPTERDFFGFRLHSVVGRIRQLQ